MSTTIRASTAATNTSFGPLKQVEAGELKVAYAEAGPSDGPVVLLLHGLPYDIHSYLEAVALLAARGYRSIVPYLRGYGSTTFFQVKPRGMDSNRFALRPGGWIRAAWCPRWASVHSIFKDGQYRSACE